MARLCISHKQVNRYVRTASGEVADGPAAGQQCTSNAARAAVWQGHRRALYPKRALGPVCESRVLATRSGCCASNIDLLKRATEAKTDPAKQEDANESEVDALTFVQSVVMSIVRGMTHGQQELPTSAVNC